MPSKSQKQVVRRTTMKQVARTRDPCFMHCVPLSPRALFRRRRGPPSWWWCTCRQGSGPGEAWCDGGSSARSGEHTQGSGVQQSSSAGNKQPSQPTGQQWKWSQWVRSGRGWAAPPPAAAAAGRLAAPRGARCPPASAPTHLFLLDARRSCQRGSQPSLAAPSSSASTVRPRSSHPSRRTMLSFWGAPLGCLAA